MVFKKGDFVTFDYTAKIKEADNKVFDTSLEEVAKKEKINKQGDKYEPRLIVVGELWVLKNIDDAFLTMEVGKPSTIEIPPEKAFGARDNEKLKQIPLEKFREKGIRPVVGKRLEFNGTSVTIRAVNSGRVTLDFNHVLAGKTLVYEITVKTILTTNEEKIQALIHRRIPTTEIDKFKLDVKPDIVTIEIPVEVFNTDGLQQVKRGVAQDIQKFFLDVTSVNFLESFKSSPKIEPSKPEQKA